MKEKQSSVFYALGILSNRDIVLVAKSYSLHQTHKKLTKCTIKEEKKL